MGSAAGKHRQDGEPRGSLASRGGTGPAGASGDDVRLRRFGLALVAMLVLVGVAGGLVLGLDRKSTRLNSSHANISYAVFCLKKKKKKIVTRCIVIWSSVA